VSVDVTGKSALQLVVTIGGDTMNYDHGDWADAKLTCGGSTTDTTPPSVTASTPANGATGQATSVAPTGTFSEAINQTTLTGTTFSLVKQGTSTAIAGTVTYNATTRVATLTPTAALTAATTYVATIKGGASGIADVAGNRLAADVTWTFTTASATGTTSYLSDLAYTTTANGWGPVEKDQSNGEKSAGDGLPLTLAGVVYAKGLGTHAASDVRYTMSSCTLFTAKVGVDDEVGINGTVVFQVFADGTKLYDSGILTGSSATASVSVDVTGKSALQLVVTIGGDTMNYDHGDWADAKLTCGP
jgi:alpha-galactosidase